MDTVMTGAADEVAMADVGTRAEAIAPAKRQRRNEEQGSANEEVPCGPQREGEQDLVPDLTPQQWTVENLYWTLRDFERDIVRYCDEQGARFEEDRLDALGTDKIVLFGRPQTKNKSLWCLMKRGYIYVRGVRIWMQPSFTGRKVSNLDLCEIEYLNTNEMQPYELTKLIQGWGGTDALIVSHAFNVGTAAKWPAIMCLRNMSRTSPELLFAFRLFFPSADEANAVYESDLQERRSNERMRNRAEGTVTLKPVSNVEWNRSGATFFRPTALEHASFVECRILVTGFSAEVSAREIEVPFEQRELGRATVEIRGPRRNYAVAELANRSSVEEALNQFGEDSADSLLVGNIVLRIKKLNDSNNQGCFKCGQVGHFRRACPDNRPGAGRGTVVTSRSNSHLVQAANGKQAALRLVESMVEGMITKKSRQLEQQLAQVHSGVTALTDRVVATEARQQAMEGQMTSFLAALENKMAAAMKTAVQELHGTRQHHTEQDFVEGVDRTSRSGSQTTVFERVSNDLVASHTGNACRTCVGRRCDERGSGKWRN